MSIYSKRDAAYQYELEMRIKALKSVKDKALISVRNKCVKQIWDYIDNKKKISSSRGIGASNFHFTGGTMGGGGSRQRTMIVRKGRKE